MPIAERGLKAAPVPTAQGPSAATLSPRTERPTTFASGRYQVQKFLGEGGDKCVYLAHDAVLDRDVALAVINGEGLDETSRARIAREARAMGFLGDHPYILPIHDLGEEEGHAPDVVVRAVKEAAERRAGEHPGSVGRGQQGSAYWVWHIRRQEC